MTIAGANRADSGPMCKRRRSGLLVSRLCLGTMTFGTDWGWGAPKEASYAILNAYLEAGGNFLDIADGYTNGTSEIIIGDFLAETKRRDEVVLVTKFSFATRPGDPNSGGNGRKHVYSALEGSLRRLKTDTLLERRYQKFRNQGQFIEAATQGAKVAG